MLRVEWDENKAKANLRKHRVRFEEAISVLNNSLSATFHDPAHSDSEDRWIVIGHSELDRIIVVSLTHRSDSIRIISARRATRNEAIEYETGKQSGR